MTSAAAGECLPAADDRVDIAGIELKSVAAPAGALGGDHRRAAAEKSVEHDVAAGRAVEDRIGDHSHRLHGRMECQQVALRATGEGVGRGIIPDIAAIAAELSELDIIAMLSAAMFKDKNKLVLAAIERAHSAVVLDPDAEIFQLAVCRSAGDQQLLEMAPIHAHVVQRALDAVRGELLAGLRQE